jgi:predicted ATP-dependent serine protease
MNMTKESYFPICPKCGFHAEMQFGTWTMCRHQREHEEQEKAQAEYDADRAAAEADAKAQQQAYEEAQSEADWAREQAYNDYGKGGP